MKTLVIGASENTDRYSNKAVKLLRIHNQEVIAIGNRKGKIDDTDIITEKTNFEGVHTITLYIGKARQPEYYEYIFSLKPKRIIFNPGTENDELLKLAAQNNIKTIEKCTLVMLNTGLF